MRLLLTYGCRADAVMCRAADCPREENGARQNLLWCAPFVLLLRTKTSDGAQRGGLGRGGLDRIYRIDRIATVKTPRHSKSIRVPIDI